MEIKEYVLKIVKKHDTTNPFEIAKRKSIIVLFEDLGNTLGFYNTYKRFKFIHINNRIDETTQRFVCAHELGHALLHSKANTPFLRNKTLYSVDRLEIEANTFAVELLLTDEMISAYEDTHLSLQEVAEIYGVPGGFACLKTY
ncbi:MULTISPECIES: ImmA/IrrE family metallo-endopeptidase [Bacillus cereus group]|uniref:ImmA/IrrE family metallo-endopeptidase n=1 Tax=Bacillus cereus group TaxID=86661 RepID=UPI0008734379|nr:MULTISPECIES: ImmA/IrrE family metallo-endopeptidase [Bacillus cereus group]OFD06190.1 putative immunity region protein 2 [Bacillus thuringiensis]MBJ8045972.1 ImmA/IrrE family metallo-endopeptidase [Bacillus cereus group sp. N18]PEA33674.1 ImmA/IrrE family metallo-endopeptidase [Bacillus toyonensis]PEG15190.1 ImmA/IrrE family metallo-endopeptidase [Bacillus toyonensis]PEK08197.1 ImmA/IrrE family metallo-endopeptidase [Bacillus toyonensis]